MFRVVDVVNFIRDFMEGDDEPPPTGTGCQGKQAMDKDGSIRRLRSDVGYTIEHTRRQLAHRQILGCLSTHGLFNVP